MAGHFLLSARARDFTLEDVDRLTAKGVHDFFAEIRWGKSGTQVCPSCGSENKHYWITSRKQWRCREHGCSRVFSVTSDTAFADHKLPLKKILKAFVIFATNVKGLSAAALGRLLGVSYQTAFTLFHKIREAISANVDETPLKGLVHIDGAHLSGKSRKPRVSLPSTKRQARDRYPPHAFPKHPNRRIVIALREVHPDKGQGATRTITGIVFSEDWQSVENLSRRYIEKGSTVYSDELGAYTKLSKLYRHRTVNHSKEFSTDDGVSNNQAESFFARVRRLIIGQVHRVTPHYMTDYINEVAWREDSRRKPTSEQVRELLGFALDQPSQKWRGYWRGKDRYFKVSSEGFVLQGG